MQIYFDNWEQSQFRGMVGDFAMASYDEAKLEEQLSLPQWQGLDVLFAAYTYESYEGDALVLFIRDGKLYEVNGGHCSCYGLEDQWDPEETTVDAILHRLNEGSKYGVLGHFESQIRAALEEAGKRLSATS